MVVMRFDDIQHKARLGLLNELETVRTVCKAEVARHRCRRISRHCNMPSLSTAEVGDGALGGSDADLEAVVVSKALQSLDAERAVGESSLDKVLQQWNVKVR